MFRRRWLWLLLAFPLVAGLARLRFDVEVLDLLPGSLPEVRGLQLHQRHFANARELLITLQGDDADKVTEVAQRLATRLSALPELVREARWQPPWLAHPADAAENLAWLWLQQPPEAVAQLAARLAPENVAAELDAARGSLASSLDPQEIARSSYDPFGLTRLPGSATGGMPGFDNGTGIFSDAGGTFRVVFVTPAKDRMNYREATEWVASVRRETGSSLALSGAPSSALQVSFTGGPAFLAEIAGGMESDLRSSVVSTIAMIAVLFWIAHRSWRPLGWLVVSLGLTLGLTLAVGGLIFGTLNVVSLGFAAILLGLAVDYGLVAYQEARDGAGEEAEENGGRGETGQAALLERSGPSSPPASTVSRLRRVRHEVAPGIGYSAVTTAGTFLLVGCAGLPGLAQLGVLTALGLLIGAVVMLWFYLPRVANVAQASRPLLARPEGAVLCKPPGRWASFGPTVLLVTLVAGALVWRGIPRLTSSTEPLRPRQSPAYAAMDVLKTRLGRTDEPSWLIFGGVDAATVGKQLAATETALTSAKERGEIGSFNLPSAFWPRPDHSVANRATLDALARRSDGFHRAAESAGFTSNSIALADGIFAAWRSGSIAEASGWPTNATARWLTSQFAAHAPDGRWLALGIVEKLPGATSRPGDLRLPDGVTATSWDSLGGALLAHVSHRVVWLTAAIGGVLVGFLCLAFRRWQEVLLAFAALGLSFAFLVAVMALLGWSWNLLNLVALPLLLGSSVDSTIHVQLALRRDRSRRADSEAGGHVDAEGAAPRLPFSSAPLRSHLASTRKALALCAGANIAGFGSLAWSSNAGLASLDLVCAVGVGCVFIVCGGLLPMWWQAVCGNEARRSVPDAVEASLPPLPSIRGSAHRTAEKSSRQGPVAGRESSPKPSSLYGARLWRAGGWLGRILPEPLCVAMARSAALAYRIARPDRFEVVVANLLPVHDGDRAAATRAAKANFANFARKLVDLWRHESGVPLGDRAQVGEGWEHFLAATRTGRGVLLVTPHLGNWEFGAPLLARRGVELLVLTAPEPGDGFTELRAEARRRQGIETLVVGEDPFAFVEVVRRLQDGGVVALLVDRPAAGRAVEVEFFGRPCLASIAAAELARATGCIVLPVFVVAEGRDHIAHTLPPIEHDRRELGDRAARIRFTGRILRAFEPAVRRFSAQWFHFVPVWPAAAPRRPEKEERT